MKANPPSRTAAINAAGRCIRYSIYFDASAVAPPTFCRGLFDGYGALTGTGWALGSIINSGALAPYTGSETGRI